MLLEITSGALNIAFAAAKVPDDHLAAGVFSGKIFALGRGGGGHCTGDLIVSQGLYFILGKGMVGNAGVHGALFADDAGDGSGVNTVHAGNVHGF